jgi:serine/threonine protein kinase
MPRIDELNDEEHTYELTGKSVLGEDISNRHAGEELSRLSTRASVRDFVYIKKLGKGSFGEVYLCKHVTSGTLYALKVMSKEKVLTQNLIRYATTEKRVMALIQHPFVVQLRFVFQTSEKLVLVMDYCSGGDLGSQLIRQRK